MEESILASLTGNLLIVSIIALDRRHHTPMEISFLSCAAQVCLLIFFAGAEYFVLTVISYDCYAAICLPLRYEASNGRLGTSLAWQRSATPNPMLPRYFFLMHLSVLNLFTITVTVLNSVHNSMTNCYSISFLGCAAQVFLLALFGCSEFYILIAMFHDHYVAICCPQHYSVIMDQAACISCSKDLVAINKIKKAFSTGSSHMIVISLSYNSCIFMYIKPTPKEGLDFYKKVAVQSTSLAPTPYETNR
ncbi:olfactory receptor 6C76-like [Tachyglossus aculeatus]|uniref:olfactory receptor 6C76-like n=1 Tax=Tachyglossus aculeatus TaxID=9261 RepID=UPI0018F6F78E|nr:olfactory receptor 6C76-like [Tachyglossus aculeatus]